MSFRSDHLRELGIVSCWNLFRVSIVSVVAMIYFSEIVAPGMEKFTYLLLRDARPSKMLETVGGEKTLLLRPVDFAYVTNARTLNAIAKPDELD